MLSIIEAKMVFLMTFQIAKLKQLNAIWQT